MTQQQTDLDQTDQKPTLHIASLIVHVRPQSIASVSQWFDRCPGLEIHLGSEEGKLVVVLETRDHFEINGTIETIKDQPGVLNVVMVYHEELTLNDADDELQQGVGACDAEQPVKIMGEL